MSVQSLKQHDWHLSHVKCGGFFIIECYDLWKRLAALFEFRGGENTFSFDFVWFGCLIYGSGQNLVYVHPTVTQYRSMVEQP